MQAREEFFHSSKFYNFINDRGGRVLLTAIDAPETEWASPTAAFQAALEHEQKVTALINGLVNLALEEKDHAANIFLQWFVTEQVEEEQSVGEVLQQLRLIGDGGNGIFMLDKELGTRAISPTVAAAMTGTRRRPPDPFTGFIRGAGFFPRENRPLPTPAAFTAAGRSTENAYVRVERERHQNAGHGLEMEEKGKKYYDERWRPAGTSWAGTSSVCWPTMKIQHMKRIREIHDSIRGGGSWSAAADFEPVHGLRKCSANWPGNRRSISAPPPATWRPSTSASSSSRPA